MNDYLFYLLKQYYEAGETGIEWAKMRDEILNNPHATHLYNQSHKSQAVATLISKYTNIFQKPDQVNIINEEGIKAYNYHIKIRIKADADKEVASVKLNLEMQKLRSENIKLADDIIDYPIIRRQRNTAYWIAIIGVLLSIILSCIAIAQYLKCK